MRPMYYIKWTYQSVWVGNYWSNHELVSGLLVSTDYKFISSLLPGMTIILGVPPNFYGWNWVYWTVNLPPNILSKSFYLLTAICSIFSFFFLSFSSHISSLSHALSLSLSFSLTIPSSNTSSFPLRH